MLKYEFFYNWDWAKEHNPALLGFGWSGGFGCVRAQMIKAVEGGDRVRAEQRFWQLIRDSLIEAKQEEAYIGIGSLDEMLETWFMFLQSKDSPEHEVHFMRLAEEGSPFQLMYQAYKDKQV